MARNLLCRKAFREISAERRKSARKLDYWRVGSVERKRSKKCFMVYLCFWSHLASLSSVAGSEFVRRSAINDYLCDLRDLGQITNSPSVSNSFRWHRFAPSPATRRARAPASADATRCPKERWLRKENSLKFMHDERLKAAKWKTFFPLRAASSGARNIREAFEAFEWFERELKE